MQKVHAATVRITVAQATAVAAKIAAQAAPETAKVDAAYFANLKIGYDNAQSRTPAPVGGFDPIGAMSSALDWYGGGALIGGGIGCLAGAIPGAIAGAALAGIGAIPGAGVGCIGGGAEGASIGGPVGMVIGLFLGGNHLPGADAFEWGPDQLLTPWKED